MKRVLMYWRVGDIVNRFIYVSKIPEDYIIPKFTDEAYFMEGRIIVGERIEDYTIELVLRGEILGHYKGREFIVI